MAAVVLATKEMEMTEMKKNPIANKSTGGSESHTNGGKQSKDYLFNAKQLGDLTSIYESDKKHAVETLNDTSREFKGINHLYYGLKTDPDRGIDTATVDERKERFGENRLPMKEFPTFCELFVDVVFTDAVMLMLLAAAIFSLGVGIYADIDALGRGDEFTGEWAEGVAILATVLFVGCLQAGIDFMKNKVFQKMQIQSADKTVDMIRDGKKQSISVYDIVVGDVMLIKYGEQLPVDALYISGDDIAIDEAALTGEPDKLKKSVEEPFLLGGTDVVSGAGRALVLGVGKNSAQGRIAMALQGEVTFIPIDGKAKVTCQSTMVLFQPRPSAGKFSSFKNRVMAQGNIKLIGQDPRADSKAEDNENNLAPGQYEVVGVNEDKVAKTWVLILKIPYESQSDLNVQLLIAEESEDAGRSVLERKLGRIALLIGYFGMIVAAIAFVTLIVRWIITDFTCLGPLGGSGSTCSRPFFFRNWFAPGPGSTSYYEFGRRYCLNDSYPAQSDWVHLCSEEPGAVSGATPCDRVTFEDGTDEPSDFWGKVTDCWTTDGDVDQLQEYAFKWLDADGNPTQDPTGTANLDWQRWDGYCPKARCTDDEMKPAYPHLTDIQHIIEFFITCITILVVAIPEGLPLAVVLALVYSSSQMAKPETNCFVKELNSCETMGNATAICSDKTGTLTMNRMVVQKLHIDGRTYLKAPAGGELAENVRALLGEVLMLNTAETTFVERPPSGGNDIYGGNASECGLVAYAMSCNFCQDDYRPADAELRVKAKYNWPKGVKLFPFHSKLKRMSIIVPRFAEDGTTVVGTRVLTKGASEQVVQLCGSHMTADGNIVSWDDGEATLDNSAEAKVANNETMGKDAHIKKLMDDAIMPFAGQMLRTFAVSYKDLDIMPEALYSEVTCVRKKGFFEKVGDAVEDVVSGEVDVAGAVDYVSKDQCETKVTEYAEGTKYFDTVDDDSEFLRDMTLIGILGLEDGVRPEVPAAIRKCARAGITVRMCTGDNIFTAKAISAHCNLIKNCVIEDITFTMADGQEMQTSVIRSKSGPVVGMEGKYFRHLVWDPVRERLKPENPNDDSSPLVFDTYWPKLRVLARCSPEDKLILVRGLKNSELFTKKGTEYEHDPDVSKHPEVVAVTGDGTNDAPALKAADVGFAMGIAGTDIAKNACDIVLQDDNFTSIVEAVKWGRNIYDSISKFLQFQLTVNVVAIVIAFVGACFAGHSPLTAVQLLWVNLIMDSLASLALATEKPTEELLNRKPIGKTTSIMSANMYRFIISSSLYQIVVLLAIYFSACQGEDRSCNNGYRFDDDQCGGWMFCPSGHTIDGPNVHYTIMFNTFVLMQIFNEINSRQLGDEYNIFKGILSNKIFLIIFFATLFTQVFIVEILNLFIYAGGGALQNPVFMTTHLSWDQWLWCVFLSGLGNVWGVLARVVIRPSCFKKLEEAGEWQSEQEMMATLSENPENSSIIGRRITKHVKSVIAAKTKTKWMAPVQ